MAGGRAAAPRAARDPRRALGELRRVAARRRWLLAAGLMAGAVATALPQLAPAPTPGTPVLTVVRDLPAGAALQDADVRTVEVPPALVPAGAVPVDERLAGRLLAGAVRRGEPLTDVRLIGPGLLATVPDRGLVAVPVRLADPASAALLRPGDIVDVLAAHGGADGPGVASVVAASVPVLAVPEQAPEVEGALVVLATPPSTATRLAGAAVSARLSVVVRPPASTG